LKGRRRMKILEIIKRDIVETQEDLASRLSQDGMHVTQATVSRDIKDLGIVKVPVGDGRYRYAVAEQGRTSAGTERLKRLFRDCCVSVDHSENLVVVKSLSGTAPAMGEAIDGLKWPEVVGTVAGDNTVLVVVRPKEAAEAVAMRLRDLAG